MATRVNRALATVVLAGVLGQGHLVAESADVATVVVHVRDYQHIDPQDLADAQDGAASVYARIGVRLVWAPGDVRPARPDGLLHVEVVMLTRAMTERGRPAAAALGLGCHLTKRASLYYARIQAYGFKSGTGFSRALALVMAHELGHVLLPDYSHSEAGLMRAELDGYFRRIPDFTREQAATIRTLLAAAQ